jgi:hypothetical protein
MICKDNRISAVKQLGRKQAGLHLLYVRSDLLDYHYRLYQSLNGAYAGRAASLDLCDFSR